MELTELLIRGSSLAVVVFVVSSTLRARRPDAAGRIRPAVGWLSNVSMILVVLLTMAGHFRSVLSVFGTFGVLAAVVYTVVCVGIGWLLGGPGTSTRRPIKANSAARWATVDTAPASPTGLGQLWGVMTARPWILPSWRSW